MQCYQCDQQASEFQIYQGYPNIETATFRAAEQLSVVPFDLIWQAGNLVGRLLKWYMPQAQVST